MYLLRFAFFLFFNLVFLYIFGAVMVEVFPLIWNFDEKNLALISSAFDTVSVILLSYGVVLEKSAALLEIFGVYPQHHTLMNSKLDQKASDLGLLIIICGLFSVVPIQFVKVSNQIINTHGLDRNLFCISLFFLVITSLLLVKYTYTFVMILKQTK